MNVLQMHMMYATNEDPIMVITNPIFTVINRESPHYGLDLQRTFISTSENSDVDVAFLNTGSTIFKIKIQIRHETDQSKLVNKYDRTVAASRLIRSFLRTIDVLSIEYDEYGTNESVKVYFYSGWKLRDENTKDLVINNPAFINKGGSVHVGNANQHAPNIIDTCNKNKAVLDIATLDYDYAIHLEISASKIEDQSK